MEYGPAWRNKQKEVVPGQTFHMSWQLHYPQNIIDAVRKLSIDEMIDIRFTETHAVFIFKWSRAKVKLIEFQQTVEALATCQHSSINRLLNLGNLVSVWLRDLQIDLPLHPVPDK